MRRWVAIGASALLAGACTPSYPIVPVGHAPAAPPPAAPAPVEPEPAPAAPAASPRPPPPRQTPSKDQCGASELQGLVGRPRTEVPIPVDPSRQRVACTSCPVTGDHDPRRLNFFFDAETGLIREVRCG